ncbi:MAG: DUF4178 domain-containing protein [Bdellovibrionaceae bacterium]|nr:DUF4178 domain-containing protein [Pseudobdellovibrionaceae bacterium]
MKLSCPACGAEVIFKSRASVFGVCSFCNSTLVRHDMDIENLGKMSLLPQDMSPLQIGSSGVFENSRFEVVGRQRVGWESGAWNEWYVHFDNGKDGWLADAQGFYMVSFQVMEPVTLPDLSALKVSQEITIKGIVYSVDDIRNVRCVGSQGELPVKGVQGRETTSVDLVGENERFANIDFSTEGKRLFLGKYAEFESFKFMNLREIDGW